MQSKEVKWQLQSLQKMSNMGCSKNKLNYGLWQQT